MAKVISQETFDEIVTENIMEFSMSSEEAKQETIKQFEAQGINLINIVKSLTINPESGKPVLNEAIDELKRHQAEASSVTTDLLGCLKTLDEECQKSLAHRVLAGKLGLHPVLLSLLSSELSTDNRNEQRPNVVVIEACLKLANSLTNKQPDIFNADALAIAIKLLQLPQSNETIICLTLQWLQKTCIMHEMNRQSILTAGTMKQLKTFVTKDQNKILREAMALFRYLVLDDDIRVDFGNAHEHARQIASEVIVDLTKLLPEYTEDVAVLADLLLTVGTLAVRQEFCTTIESAGGLSSVFEIMTGNLKSERLNREALKLLRALAGNDGVKAHMVHQGVAPIIKNVLETHAANENLATAALACISTLTLRVKENSAAFFETGIAEIIVETVRLHPMHKIIQRNAAWTIRNMVSRSREQCDTWLSFGIEELLNIAMTQHPTVQQDIKAALRDLGCKVDLKEEWTGTAEKKITKTIL